MAADKAGLGALVVVVVARHFDVISGCIVTTKRFLIWWASKCLFRSIRKSSNFSISLCIQNKSVNQ